MEKLLQKPECILKELDLGSGDSGRGGLGSMTELQFKRIEIELKNAT